MSLPLCKITTMSVIHITKEQIKTTKTVFIVNSYYEGKQTIEDICLELVKKEIATKEGVV